MHTENKKFYSKSNTKKELAECKINICKAKLE